MAEFPLEPTLAKLLIMSVDLGCSDDMLTIVSMISVENIFYRPREAAEAAEMKKERFNRPEGDHLTLLEIYNAWRRSTCPTAWCYQNFVQNGAMQKVKDIREQLLNTMGRNKLEVRSCGKQVQQIQKAICSGFFRHAAKRDKDGYRTLTDGQGVYMHPSSSLFKSQPQWVVYHVAVMTNREYMREVGVSWYEREIEYWFDRARFQVTAVDPKWLTQFAPAYYKMIGSGEVSQHKRAEKIAPLHKKHEGPDEWRISRVKRKVFNANR